NDPAHRCIDGSPEPRETLGRLRTQPRTQTERRGAPALIDRHEIDRVRGGKAGRSVTRHPVCGAVLREPTAREGKGEINRIRHRTPLLARPGSTTRAVLQEPTP